MNSPPFSPTSQNRRSSDVRGRIRRLGYPLSTAIINMGRWLIFICTVIARGGLAFRRPGLIVRQLREVGVGTLIIILVAGLCVGFILGLQFYVLLNRYGQLEFIGAGVALILFRELGPVGAGLLFVGCSCASITAAIGLKKAGEQIAAMEMMAIDPIARELSPRLYAGMMALPLLTIYFDAVGIFGAYLIVVRQIGIDESIFWDSMQQWVLFYDDFLLGTLKSVFFGFAAVSIAVYEGYYCTPTAAGVATATTRAVIKGSLAVLGLNFILTAFMIK